MEKLKELDLLKEISEILNKETDRQKMLQSVLEHLLSLTHLETGWIFTFDQFGKMELSSSVHLPEALCYENKRYMCEGGCRCVEQYNSGRLNKATNIIECKRIEEGVKFNRGDTEGITHHASIPLKAGEKMYGILNVASPNKLTFTNKELAVLESVAFQVGSAIQRLELFENEKKLHLIEERNRLARDLHDQVNQLLFSIMYIANGTKSLTSNVDILHSLGKIQQMSQDALTEMKSLIWNLKADLSKDGFEKSIKTYASKIGVSIQCKSEYRDPLPEYIQIVLYRIAQESLNNIKKHSQCLTGLISLRETKLQLIMVIKDYGVGFASENNSGLGFLSMKERAASIGGTCKITSKENAGTTVTVIVPFKK